MPIEETRKKIYVFIRNRNEEKMNVYWKPHIMLFVMKNKISRQEGGYALQQLKEKGAVSFSKKYGWIAR